MLQKVFVLIFVLIVLVGYSSAQVNRKARTITVLTEPNAVLWIDGVRRGETDQKGKLVVKPVTSGTLKLRVRADGFKEVNKILRSTQKGVIKITLVKTNDPAELTFQEAEKMMFESKSKAVDLYKTALRLRPRFREANIGLARALSSLGNYKEALEAISKARKIHSVYPEASAVEGRIYKSMGEYDKAIASFDRAIREGKGFQPEAHTGLALLFKEEAESANADNDTEDEKYYYAEAAKSFEKAIAQLSGTEPVVYLFLGKIYEDTGNKKKAIAVYQRFLQDMPDHSEVPAVESFIYQLKQPEVIR